MEEINDNIILPRQSRLVQRRDSLIKKYSYEFVAAAMIEHDISVEGVQMLLSFTLKKQLFQ